MRILYLNPFSQEVSGPDESLRTLLSALVPRGIEAHVVLPKPGPQVPRYEAIGVHVHYAPLATLRRDLSVGVALYPGRLASAVLRIALLARRLRIQLIHTNMEVLLEGGIAARLLGIPHVLHYRGNTLDRPRWVFDILAAVWTAGADHIYCISEATAQVFRRRGRDRKVDVLYNPIDRQAFSAAARSEDVRSSLGARSDQILVGTVGRIHPRKDLETFLRAAGIVAARIPEARFAIVGAPEGEAEQSYFDRLRRLTADLAIDQRVTFAGNRRDIPAVMRAFDLFVLCSRHEGFGRVVAEAMAAGRPIVVTNEGAPPELLQHGRCGISASPADPQDFAEQILRLIGDRALAARLADAAAVASIQFDVTQVAERVATLYRKLLLG